jgi:hypothetical protein
MRICGKHWAALREAIAQRGISQLVAKSGEAAFESLKADLEGRSQLNDYDPLMDCNWMISNRALSIFGLSIMSQREDGSEHCPVCEAETAGAEPGSWIEGPADAALLTCREKGLAPAVS